MLINKLFPELHTNIVMSDECTPTLTLLFSHFDLRLGLNVSGQAQFYCCFEFFLLFLEVVFAAAAAAAAAAWQRRYL